MTHLRAPLTFPAAMTRVAGVIGWPACAKMAARRERTVRYWSEDRCKATPPVIVRPSVAVAPSTAVRKKRVLAMALRSSVRNLASGAMPR